MLFTLFAFGAGVAAGAFNDEKFINFHTQLLTKGEKVWRDNVLKH